VGELTLCWTGAGPCTGETRKKDGSDALSVGGHIVRLLLYFVELLFVALVWRALGRVIRSVFGATGANPSSSGARSSAGNASSPPAVHGKTARDPVCGMFVSTELSVRLERDGKTVHFCSSDCLARYEKQRAEVSG
jgi:YHS domain-containing protein